MLLSEKTIRFEVGGKKYRLCMIHYPFDKRVFLSEDSSGAMPVIPVEIRSVSAAEIIKHNVLQALRSIEKCLNNMT